MSAIEQHYSAPEVAQLLGVSERTIKRYVDLGTRSGGKEGIFPVVKLSHKAVRIPARAVNRFLRARTISS